MNVELSVQEFHTVLAGLRAWQSLLDGSILISTSDLNDVASDMGSVEPLTPIQIEGLIQRLNSGDKPRGVKWVQRIEFYWGIGGFYDTAYGPWMIVDHDLSHDEAMRVFDAHFQAEENLGISIFGVYSVDTEVPEWTCPTCGHWHEDYPGVYRTSNDGQLVYLECESCGVKFENDVLLSILNGELVFGGDDHDKEKR